MESSDNVSKHKRLIEDGAFLRAKDFAMLEYLKSVNEETASNPGMAASGAFKLLGASQFMHQMMTLAETPPPPAQHVDMDNLKEHAPAGALRKN